MKRPTAYAKRKATKEIRLAVWVRSAGVCECCSMALGEDGGELDHQFGRVRVKQSAETTWRLCRPCHARKTLNSPSAIHWWERIAWHAQRYGYLEVAERAAARVVVLEAKGLRGVA